MLCPSCFQNAAAAMARTCWLPPAYEAPSALGDQRSGSTVPSKAPRNRPVLHRYTPAHAECCVQHRAAAAGSRSSGLSIGGGRPLDGPQLSRRPPDRTLILFSLLLFNDTAIRYRLHEPSTLYRDASAHEPGGDPAHHRNGTRLLGRNAVREIFPGALQIFFRVDFERKAEELREGRLGYRSTAHGIGGTSVFDRVQGEVQGEAGIEDGVVDELVFAGIELGAEVEIGERNPDLAAALDLFLGEGLGMGLDPGAERLPGPGESLSEGISPGSS